MNSTFRSSDVPRFFSSSYAFWLFSKPDGRESEPSPGSQRPRRRSSNGLCGQLILGCQQGMFVSAQFVPLVVVSRSRVAQSRRRSEYSVWPWVYVWRTGRTRSCKRWPGVEKWGCREGDQLLDYRSENSCTSFLPLLPRANSRQASSRFSGLTISSKVLSNLILINLCQRTPPPARVLPILQKLIAAYKLWRGYWIHLDKLTRFGLGAKIESLFIETIQNIFIASHKTKEGRRVYLDKASDVFDLLKFLLQIMWEMKTLDSKKYIALSKHLQEIGRMLGGWQRQTKTP